MLTSAHALPLPQNDFNVCTFCDGGFRLNEKAGTCEGELGRHRWAWAGRCAGGRGSHAAAALSP